VIRLFDDPEAVSRAAADLFVRQARQAVTKRGCFKVALAGGHSPRRTYELLAEPSSSNRIAWKKIDWFWGDERCIAADDERNNAQMARLALLQWVLHDDSRGHPILCTSDPGKEAVRYDKLLHSHFPKDGPTFDLAFLGLGQNGHTASLFPFSRLLEERERWAAEVYPANEEMVRVTLTAPLFNMSRLVIVLVFGRDKAQILREVLEGPAEPSRLPVQLIRPKNGQMIWLIDREAASLLNNTVFHKESK